METLEINAHCNIVKGHSRWRRASESLPVHTLAMKCVCSRCSSTQLSWPSASNSAQSRSFLFRRFSPRACGWALTQRFLTAVFCAIRLLERYRRHRPWSSTDVSVRHPVTRFPRLLISREPLNLLNANTYAPPNDVTALAESL